MKKFSKIAVAAVVVCAVFFGVFVFMGNGQATLYAQVLEGLQSVTSLRYTVEEYSDGVWGKSYETWYDVTNGSVEDGHPGNRYQIRIDDGKYLWRCNPGEDYIVRSESIGPESHFDRFISGVWSNTKATRKPEGDMNIDGVYCRLYHFQYNFYSEVHEQFSWIEEVQGKKFLRYWESYNQQGNGELMPLRRGRIEYNIPIAKDVFSPDIDAETTIVDADAFMSEQYGLESALFKKEVMGLQFAVHSLEMSEDGPVLVTCSLRPTEETILRLGSLDRNISEKIYSRMEIFSISDGKLIFPYTRIKLWESAYNGIEMKSWILIPRKEWADNNELPLGVRVYSGHELKHERLKNEMPEMIEFKPMGILTLPSEYVQIKDLLSQAYSDAQALTPIQRVLLWSGDMDRLPAEKEAEQDFRQQISILIEEARKAN